MHTNFESVSELNQDQARAMFTSMLDYRDLEAFKEADMYMRRMVGPGSCTIVDVGVGNGENAKELARDGHTVIGVDVRDDVQTESSDGSWEFREGSAEKIPMADASADVVWANRLVHHLPNPEAFYEEASRVLKPSGKLLVTWPQGSDFRCSDPGAQLGIRAYLTSGENNVNPASLAEVISCGTKAGLELVDAAHHGSRHYGPKPPYQLRDYYNGQSEKLQEYLSAKEAGDVARFMHDLASGNAWLEIHLTTAYFRKAHLRTDSRS